MSETEPIMSPTNTSDYQDYKPLNKSGNGMYGAAQSPPEEKSSDEHVRGKHCAILSEEYKDEVTTAQAASTLNNIIIIILLHSTLTDI